MSAPGIPDLIGCFHGRFFAIEVKRPGGVLSQHQARTIANIRDAGGIAIVATCVDDVINGLDLHREVVCQCRTTDNA